MSQLFWAGKSQQGQSAGNKNWGVTSGSESVYEDSEKVINKFVYLHIRIDKAHSLCKQCLHDLYFLKKGSFSPNLSKPVRADISCHFLKEGSFAELFTQWIDFRCMIVKFELSM